MQIRNFLSKLHRCTLLCLWSRNDGNGPANRRQRRQTGLRKWPAPRAQSPASKRHRPLRTRWYRGRSTSLLRRSAEQGSLEQSNVRSQALHSAPCHLRTHTHTHTHTQLGPPRVLKYSSTTRVVNYLSNLFLLLEYSLLSIPGCIFAVNWWIVGICGNLGLRDFICNLPAWKQIWINRSEYISRWGSATQPAAGATTRSLSLAACFKVFPVLTSTRVEHYSLAAALHTVLAITRCHRNYVGWKIRSKVQTKASVTLARLLQLVGGCQSDFSVITVVGFGYGKTLSCVYVGVTNRMSNTGRITQPSRTARWRQLFWVGRSRGGRHF